MRPKNPEANATAPSTLTEELKCVSKEKIRKVFASVSRAIIRDTRLRPLTLGIFGGMVFGLLTVENIGLFGYNLTVLMVSCVLGFVFGFYDFRTTTREIEKKGEFRRAWKPILLVTGIAILLFSLSIYGLALGIVSITILRSVIAFVPTMFLGQVLFLWRWEARNHKEVQSVGSGRAILYAIPKGLSSDEKFRVRWDMQQRLLQKSG